MGETFCCVICRLMQERSPTCVECGGSTMISLEAGAEALRFDSTNIQGSPQTRREKIGTVAGTLGMIAGYVGIGLGAAFWWPAIPLVLGTGAGAVTFAVVRGKDKIVGVELLPVAIASGAIEKRGIARKLSDSTKSLTDSSPILAEQIVVRKNMVLLRRTNAVPFLLDVEGERIVVAGIVRLTSAPQTKKKLDKSIAAALGIPSNLTVNGVVETTALRDGDSVRVTGTISVEMVPELAFHRDAGEANVMRGAANAVVAIMRAGDT